MESAGNKRALEAIRKRASFHNIVYIFILILSLCVFGGEIFVTIKTVGHKHQDIPLSLVYALVVLSGILFFLAFLDRYLAWKHRRNIKSKLQDQIDTCEAQLLAPILHSKE